MSVRRNYWQPPGEKTFRMTGMVRIRNNSSTCRLMQKQKEKWVTKPLRRQFLRQTQQIPDSKSWVWLTTSGLKKETEGFLMAAQDQALQTNAIKLKIDKWEGEATCRMCKSREKKSLT